MHGVKHTCDHVLTRTMLELRCRASDSSIRQSNSGCRCPNVTIGVVCAKGRSSCLSAKTRPRHRRVSQQTYVADAEFQDYQSMCSLSSLSSMRFIVFSFGFGVLTYRTYWIAMAETVHNDTRISERDWTGGTSYEQEQVRTSWPDATVVQDLSSCPDRQQQGTWHLGLRLVCPSIPGFVDRANSKTAIPHFLNNNLRRTIIATTSHIQTQLVPLAGNAQDELPLASSDPAPLDWRLALHSLHDNRLPDSTRQKNMSLDRPSRR